MDVIHRHATVATVVVTAAIPLVVATVVMVATVAIRLTAMTRPALVARLATAVTVMFQRTLIITQPTARQCGTIRSNIM